MNLDQIFKLLDAGFTKDEILALSNASTNTASPDQPAAPEEPAAAPEDQEQPKQEPEPAPEPVKINQEKDQQQQAVLSAINSLTAAIQKSNLLNAEIHGGDVKPLTGEDILANIINPPNLGKK